MEKRTKKTGRYNRRFTALLMCIAFVLATISISGSGVETRAETPDQTDWFAKNCWQKIEGKWYFFDQKGNMLKDAYQHGASGKYWYLTKSGAWDEKKEVVGWKQDAKGWWFGLYGKDYIRNTWKMIDGHWYYFKSNGYIATSEYVQGYWLNANGTQTYKPKASWKKKGDVWYYSDTSGWYAKNQWMKIDNEWYCFDAKGRCYTNTYIGRKYFVNEKGQWDGITIKDIPEIGDMDLPPSDLKNNVSFVFYQNGWYVARFAVEVYDEAKGTYSWIYSDGCTKGQCMILNVDTSDREIKRVGYQVWSCGWDNMYYYMPWYRAGNSTTYYLSGYGDHPEFTWKDME